MTLNRQLFLVFFIAFLLQGCGEPPTAAIPPSPTPLRVSYSPYLAGIQDALHACAVEAPHLAVFFEQIPAAQQDFSEDDLVVWWGDKPENIEYAYPLHDDQLVVIVHPDNPKQELSSTELVSLFSGRIERWTEIGIHDQQVEIWIFPEDNLLTKTFATGVLGNQRITRLASLAPSSQAMLESIAGDPGAIGFLLQSWITPEVQAVQIAPHLQSALTKPLLALTPSEPQGGLKDLVACLQDGAGQEILSSYYDRPG